MDEVVKIINDIKAGNIKPIYFLMGDEPYFIDKLTEYFEQNILQEHERDFNQTILYGRDTTVEDVVGNAKRYPMMADRQVVIVREAQDLKSIDKLESYLENPQNTTVLVFAYKYGILDKRKKVTKLISKNGVLFESKKMFDNNVGTWLTRVLKGRGLTIEPKANIMLVEHLGVDLSRISNEIDKLEIILPKGHTITPKDIEVNIGVSKDFNVFELINAIAAKNHLKAFQIAQYLADHSKDNNPVKTISLVSPFFIKVLKYHGLKDKNPKTVPTELGIAPFHLKNYDLGLKNYPMKKVSAILSILRDADVKSKGVGANSISDHDLYNEMLGKIFN